MQIAEPAVRTTTNRERLLAAVADARKDYCVVDCYNLGAVGPPPKTTQTAEAAVRTGSNRERLLAAVADARKDYSVVDCYNLGIIGPPPKTKQTTTTSSADSAPLTH